MGSCERALSKSIGQGNNALLGLVSPKRWSKMCSRLLVVCIRSRAQPRMRSIYPAKKGCLVGRYFGWGLWYCQFEWQVWWLVSRLQYHIAKGNIQLAVPAPEFHMQPKYGDPLFMSVHGIHIVWVHSETHDIRSESSSRAHFEDAMWDAKLKRCSLNFR